MKTVALLSIVVGVIWGMVISDAINEKYVPMDHVVYRAFVLGCLYQGENVSSDDCIGLAVRHKKELESLLD